MMPDADVDHCDDDNEISSLGAREIDNKRGKVKSTKPFDVCVCAKLHLASQIRRSRQKKTPKMIQLQIGYCFCSILSILLCFCVVHIYPVYSFHMEI